MDVLKLLSDIKSLKKYSRISEEMEKNIAHLKLPCNMPAALRNIQALEVQYFLNYKKAGAAAIVFELLLQSPVSENWDIISRELVLVLKYWLTCVKYLILKNEHWWEFMEKLLDLTQKLVSIKDPLVIMSLMEVIGECLLQLATRKELTTEQRYQILKCFKDCAGLTQRDLRNDLRPKFDVYFTKLAAWLPRCDDACAQWAALETLVRFLVPRDDERARRRAAELWLPRTLYSSPARREFVQKSWLHFDLDARSFLNAVNESSDRIISIILEKLYIGNVAINTRSREHWLDLSTGTSKATVMLTPALQRALSVPNLTVMLITAHNTATVNMYSGTLEPMILFKVIDPMRILPSQVLAGRHDVRMYVSPNSNMNRVDRALRTIFDNKYQLLRDCEYVPESESSRYIDYTSEENTRFSIPENILYRKPVTERASSKPTSSASSPAMLRIKFPAGFNNKLETAGLNARQKPELQTEKTCHSFINKPDLSSTNNQELNLQNCFEKVVDENANNDPTNKNLDVNQFVQEALQYSRVHASENTHDHSNVIIDHTHSANVTIRTRRCDKRESNHKRALISNFVETDDSNTAFVEDTPAVDINRTNRKTTVTHIKKDKTKDSKDSCFRRQTFDNEAVEDFFSQHFAESTNGNLIVSPTLARKINESEFELSGSFTLCRPPETETRIHFISVEVEDCLNFVVDKVCENLEKNKENFDQNEIYINKDRLIHMEENYNMTEKDKNKSTRKTKKKTKSTPVIKLKFKNTKNQTKKNNKLDLKSIAELPPIEEKESDLDKTALSINNRALILPGQKSPTDEEIETPLNKRKRKLYSKKDETSIMDFKKGIYVSETEEDNSVLVGCTTVNKSPIPTATPYKELENLRKIAAARHLNRKSKVISPKTAMANNLFDQLKKTIENEDKATLVDMKLVDKGAMYNMSSSSEDDEDFKRKKVVSRHNENSDKQKKTKRSPTKHKSDSGSKDNGKEINSKLTRSKSKLQMDKQLIPRESITDLADERMRRGTTEALNTSLLIESHNEELILNNELQPAHKKPRMEIVPNNQEYEIVASPNAKKTKKHTKNTKQRAKERKNITKNKLVITTDKADDDRKTISPLPGLEIETAQKVDEPDDSIISLDKLNYKYEGNLNALDITQNLLSESEQVDNSTSKLNITDEYNEAIRNASRRSNTEKGKSIKRGRNTGSLSDSGIAMKDKKLLVVLDRLDFHSPKSRTEELSEYSRRSNNKKSNIENKPVRKTRSSSNRSNTSKDNIDIIDIHSSDSMLTVGRRPITAHGDVDQSPPPVEEIEKTIKPRSLETEQFSENALDFFNKLTNDLTNISTDNGSRHSKRLKRKADKSQRELESSDSTDNRNRHFRDLNRSAEKSKTEHETSDKKIKEKSPSVYVTRLPQKEIDIYFKRLKRNSQKFQSELETLDSDKEKTPSVNITRLPEEEMNGYLLASRNLTFDSSPTPTSDVSEQTPKEQIKNENKKKKRNTIISPILFDESMFNKNRSFSSQEEPKSPLKSEPQKTESTKRYNLRRFGKTYSNKKSQSVKSSEVLTQSDDKAKKTVAKKPQIDINTTPVVSEVNPSGSSVHEWFLRNERHAQSGRDPGVGKEILRSMQEKVETTLKEIVHSTRTSMIKNVALFECESEEKDEFFRKMLELLNEYEKRRLENFKRKSHEILVEHVRKVREFLKLLSEDIRAAIHSDDDDDNAV